MVVGYILVSTKNSYEHEIAAKLTRLGEVVDVEPLIVEETALVEPFFEDYDLVVKIKTGHSKDIKKFIDDKIRNIRGVETVKIISRSS